MKDDKNDEKQPQVHDDSRRQAYMWAYMWVPEVQYAEDPDDEDLVYMLRHGLI